ncbi:MAG: CoA transferase [Pseudomonadota bacterium]
MSEQNPNPPRGSQPGALDGVRVLDFSALIAGPSCGKYLADHGADVIKMERFPEGDVSRASFGGEGTNRGPMFLQHNAGKRSVCIDIKHASAQAVIEALVQRADVVIEAFTPGVMTRLGYGYESLRTINPRIIVCSISGFGQTGPNSARPGYAHISHAMTGWLAMQFLHREPPEKPRGPGIAIGDTTAGLTAFGAICAALFRRERTGEGEHIDIALFDALFGSNDVALQTALLTDEFSVWYHPVHATKDGYVTANVGPDFRAWRNVCRAMGRPELLTDPRFCDGRSVREHKIEAGEIVSEWLAGLTSAEAETVLTEHHVACGIVRTLQDAVRQPQVSARELVVEVDDPVLGSIDLVNSAFRYRHARSGVSGPAPKLGANNRQVLREWLQYGDESIDQLEADGVLKAEQY